jgi:predicted nucleic acid-binding protein
MTDTYFVDTVFIQALLDKNDHYHAWALKVMPKVRSGRLVITEAIFIEVTAALAGVNRSAAASFVRQCYSTAGTEVISLDHDLFVRGLSLYEARPDKTWSLVDCISFVVMHECGLECAVSTDHHFEQAGFRLLV